MKRPNELDCVVLKHGLPEFGLKAGDIGTVVHVYPREAVEVEFMDEEGDTVALLTLLDTDVRNATPRDFRERNYPDPLPPGVDPPIADATRANR